MTSCLAEFHRVKQWEGDLRVALFVLDLWQREFVHKYCVICAILCAQPFATCGIIKARMNLIFAGRDTR